MRLPLKKIKAGALAITLIISIVAAVFCTMLILIAYYNRLTDIDQRQNQKLQRNVQSGIQIVLNDTASINRISDRTIDLFGLHEDSVHILTRSWGIFPLATISAFSMDKKDAISFLYGTPSIFIPDCCIYLADRDRYLSLVGNTQLVGNAFVPKMGLRPGFVDQKGFNFDKLIEGKTTNSDSSLPPIDSGIQSSVISLLNYIKQPPGNYISPKNLNSTVKISFTDSTRYYYSKEPVSLLEGMYITGNVVIISAKEITIDSNCRLDNVILIAPHVRFQKNFSGNVHAFATDEIELSKGCKLKYPSSLVVYGFKDSTGFVEMKLDSSVLVSGFILGMREAGFPEQRLMINAGKDLSLQGGIYADGFLTIQGKVYGNVFTKFFMYRSESSMYENLLYDTEINIHKLPRYFSGPVFFNKQQKKTITQWLY